MPLPARTAGALLVLWRLGCLEPVPAGTCFSYVADGLAGRPLGGLVLDGRDVSGLAVQVLVVKTSRCVRSEPALDEIGRPIGLRALTERRLADLAAADALKSRRAHQPFDRAARDPNALTVQSGVDPPGAADTEVVLVNNTDVLRQLHIPDHPHAQPLVAQ